MNVNKRSTMNNIKKLGLTALAGSLALATSASAVEYALSGDAYVSFSSADSDSSETGSGKNYASDMDLYFNASTELDNGFTVSFFQAVNTNSTLSVSSSQVTLGMGSLGTIQLNDTAGGKANGIDDVMPYAMQETWDRVGDTDNQTNPSFFGSATQNGSIEYRIPTLELAGASINASASYDPNTGENSGNASTHGVATSVPGTAYTLQASMMGFEIGGGVETSDDSQGVALSSDTQSTTAYVKYSVGPISAGYQEAYRNNRNGTGVEGADNEAEFWSVALTQGDFSVSYGESSYAVKQVSDTAAVPDQEYESIQASYSMGAMTIMAAMSEGSNIANEQSKNYEETSVAVNFAF